MSRTQLKKLLSGMPADRMAKLLLDLYEARPEAREYLDFYVSPDIDRRLDKAKAAITKELSRMSRGYSKARITKVRRIIKDISSLDPGADSVAEIMAFAFECICRTAGEAVMKQTLRSGAIRLMRELIRYADTAGMLSCYLVRIEAAVDGMESGRWKGGEFKKILESELDRALNSL